MSEARKGALNRSDPDLTGLHTTIPTVTVPEEPNPLPFVRHSSLNPDALERLLADHPNRPLVDFVVGGARHGFRLGVRNYKADRLRQSKNLVSAERHPEALFKWIDTELRHDRISGPHLSPPHDHLQIFPVGVVSKKGYDMSTKCRAIFHLSKDFGDGQPSLNAHVDHEDCTIEYDRVSNLVDSCRDLEQHGDAVHLAAVDIVNAHRNVLLCPEEQHLVGFQVTWHDGKPRYFSDRALGFGHARGPRMFDAIVQCMQWILENRIAAAGLRARVHHLLDDIAIAGASRADTAAAFDMLKELLAEVGLPMQEAKTVPPTQAMDYLGLTVDTLTRAIRIPDDKRADLIRRLVQFTAHRRIRTRDLESMIGKLGFSGVAMPALRPRINAWYSVLLRAKREGQAWASLSHELNRSAKTFLAVLQHSATGPHTSFDSFAATPAGCQVSWCTDASGPDGAGGFSLANDEGNPEVFHFPWPRGWACDDDDSSSTLQELVAINAVVQHQAPHCESLAVWTDSSAAVDALAKGRSPNADINKQLNLLLETAAANSCLLVVAWHARSGPAAQIADLMSHNLQDQLSTVHERGSTLSQACRRMDSGIPSRLCGHGPPSSWREL